MTIGLGISMKDSLFYSRGTFKFVIISPLFMESKIWNKPEYP